MELKTARLTILLDPSTKDAFDVACRDRDLTPSQVVRRMIRDFMDANGQAAAPMKKVSKRSAPRHRGAQ